MVPYTFNMEETINHLQLSMQISKKTLLILLILYVLLDKRF